MVKIDTKENFRIFHLFDEEITEKMTGELKNLLLQNKMEIPGNAIIHLPEKTNFPGAFFIALGEVQSAYLNENLSFWVAPVSNELQKNYSAFNHLNHTPTLVEAIDMVMMEKLERELSEPGDKEES